MAAGVLLTCADRSPRDFVDEQVTDVFGGTCGEWQISPPEEPLQKVRVDCGEGLECLYMLTVYPEKMAGNRYGRCIPPDADCSASEYVPGEYPCADVRLTCDIAPESSSPGNCYLRCEVAQDCPGPLQTCRMGKCRFTTCDDDHECYGLTHCENRLCVQD